MDIETMTDGNCKLGEKKTQNTKGIVRLGSGQHLCASMAAVQRQRAWIVTWHAAATGAVVISNCHFT